MLKRKIFNCIIIILVALLFVVPFLFAKNVSVSDLSNRNWFAPVFYGLMASSSIAILITYCIIFKKKYFWLLLTIISVCICNVGYFALSLSTTVTEAVLANKIAYFGNVFLPLFLLVTIADACRFRYSKFLVRVLFSISVILFLFCATGGYLDLFYKSVEFKMVNGIAHLHKTYGIMHAFYMLYILIYFGLMIALVFYSHKKGKIISQKHIIYLLLIVFINIFLWLLEKFIHIPVEILSFSYVLTSILTICVYKQLNKFGLLDSYNLSLGSQSEKEDKVEIEEESEEPCEELVIEDNFANFSDDKLKEMFKNLKLENSLTDREIEVAILMIKNIKRKKIAEFLVVTEHTIKFHVSSIFRKTNVSNRNELADLLKKNL